MSEFITIQVGQCGNQIGSAFWPLVLHEHGIQVPRESGYLPRNLQPNRPRPHLTDTLHSFFWSPDDAIGTNVNNFIDLENAKIKARAICIDMEDSVVARYRTGPLRSLFDDMCLLTNYPGSGNNWAEGHLTHGSRYNHAICNLLRQMAERCDRLHGFLLLFSLGGGTGSGLGSAVLGMLEEQFPHIDRFVTCVYPAGNEDVITAPYNVALASRELTRHASCVFPVDNKALLEICGRLRSNRDGTESVGFKPFQDMNSVVVNMLLHLTSGSRFPGGLNVDMNEIANNLVPFPGLQYVVSSLSPLSTAGIKGLAPGRNIKQDDMFAGAWSRDHQLVKVDALSGVLLGVALVARGAVSMSDVRRNVDRLQERAKFTSWSHDAMKVGLCSVPPPGHPSSVLGLFNSSSLANLFQDVANKFVKLYHRRAHVHHYLQVEGFQEADFLDSLASLHDTAATYQELEKRQPVLIPRLQAV